MVKTLVATQSNGERYFADATYKTLRKTRIYNHVGPADLYEHINVFVTPENECVLARPMLKYYSRMQDIILRNCRRRVERGEVGASTRAQVVWETITKESTLRGTSISSQAKQDFGYWMDHRISYEIKIDDESVMLKFGLVEDPIAVASVSCVLYVDIRARSSRIIVLFFEITKHHPHTTSGTHPLSTKLSARMLLHKAIYEEQVREQTNRAEKGGGWNKIR